VVLTSHDEKQQGRKGACNIYLIAVVPNIHTLMDAFCSCASDLLPAISRKTAPEIQYQLKNELRVWAGRNRFMTSHTVIRELQLYFLFGLPHTDLFKVVVPSTPY
jgi:hypothetical protein